MAINVVDNNENEKNNVRNKLRKNREKINDSLFKNMKMKGTATLLAQFQGFLDYATEKGLISKDVFEEINELLYSDELDYANFSILKTQLSGILTSEEFDKLYDEYTKWLKTETKNIHDITHSIFLEEYQFLSESLYFKNYFYNKKLSEEDKKYYKTIIEKNILAFKKNDIDDKYLKYFLKYIISNDYSSIIEKNLNLLYKNGISDIKKILKFVKVFDFGTEQIEEKIECLKSFGFKTPEDLTELNGIITSGCHIGVLKENLDILIGVGITSPKDLNSLNGIITSGKYPVKKGFLRRRMGFSFGKNSGSGDVGSNLRALTQNGIVNAEELKKLRSIIIDGNPQIINSLIDAGITSSTDLLKFKNIINSEYRENFIIGKNIKKLKSIGINETDDLIKYIELLNSNIDLSEFDIESPEQLKILQSLVIKDRNKGSRYYVMINAGINSLGELIKYRNDFEYKCYDCEINSRINLLKELGIINLSDLLKRKDTFGSYHSKEDIRGKFVMLNEVGIKDPDDIIKFKDIIFDYTDPQRLKSKIEVLQEIGITKVGDIIKLKELITSHIDPAVFKVKLEILKDHGLTKLDDLINFKEIINDYCNTDRMNQLIGVLIDCGITDSFDIVKFESVFKGYGRFKGDDIKNGILLLQESGIDNIDDIAKLGEFLGNGRIINNITIYNKYFGNFAEEKDIDYKIDLLCNVYFPDELNFKEDDHKGYLKYIVEIGNTNYDSSKKKEISGVITTLTFDQCENYLKIFKLFDDSISMDIQRIKNELIDEILKSDQPEQISKKIIDIFERNNLPLTGKIFKVFELLYPINTLKRELNPSKGYGTLGSPVLNDYVDNGKDVYGLIYKDLMNIAIKSGDRSLRKYINIFVGSEELIKKFESIVDGEGFNYTEENCLEGKLDSKEKEKLLYILRRMSVLYNRYFGKEIDEEEGIENLNLGESNVSDAKLVSFYLKLKKGFHVKEGNSIYDRMERFLYGLGYHKFDEVLKDMDEAKESAHERGLKLFNESQGGKIKFPEHAFIKGVREDAFSKIINRGINSREYLGGGDDGKDSWNGGTGAGSDCTPFDIDGLYVDSYRDRTVYGNILLVVNTDRGTIVDTSEKGLDGDIMGKYELFKTGGNDHYGIRTGIPTTEVDYIIYSGRFDSKEFQDMCYEIARNGYYIPITDKEGNIIFKPEMYHKIRSGFNYMQYYDGFDIGGEDGKYYSIKGDDVIHRGGENEELNTLIEENSPTNEKFINFANSNRELARDTIQFIKKVLEEECGIKFNSEFDTSINGAELHDSGSTGRGTDIPTKDVDLDFTLLLDAKDYERIEEITRTIHKAIGTIKDDDHKINENAGNGNQIKSKKNKLGLSDERPDGIPLDLLILKKSQVIDYSSSDAMKEKLLYIAANKKTGKEDYNRVRTNVIIMKKLLKAKGCYKKPEGGISGIGVENRILQNHGNFIEALETFEKVAYNGKEYSKGEKPIPLSEFKKLYPMYDAGENYKDGGNDNFVYKLEENGYKGTLEIIQAYREEGIEGIRKIIREYEEKKSQYIE